MFSRNGNDGCAYCEKLDHVRTPSVAPVDVLPSYAAFGFSHRSFSWLLYTRRAARFGRGFGLVAPLRAPLYAFTPWSQSRAQQMATSVPKSGRRFVHGTSTRQSSTCQI